MGDLIRKSAGASLAIAIGIYVLLMTNSFIGMVLFALGLMTVCYLKLNLFTGKCGWALDSRQNFKEIWIILAVNLITGYIFGIIIGVAEPGTALVAAGKVAGWSFSVSYFIRSAFCGMVMYLAVALYKKQTVWGVLLGVPLFIVAGMQHSIANVITMGCALEFSPLIFFCAAGNWAGSLAVHYLTREKE